MKIVGCFIAPLMLCLVTTPDLRTQTVPTWSGEIAPIIFSKCTPCHRGGEIAPFPLETYNDVAARASMIAAVTSSRYMPPWKPDHTWGSFLGDRSLTNEQIQAIQDWVAAGSPPGNLAEAPQPPVFPDGSQLGIPDLVLEMSEPWTVKGNSRDVYRYFVLPTNLLEDKTIRALEFRPGNAQVVHHVLYFLDTTGTARMRDADDPEPGYSGFGDPGFESSASYLGWVPGSQMRFYPDGIGARMFKGSDLVVQVHYAPSAIEQTDRSKVNVFFSTNADPRVIQEFALSPRNLRSGSFVLPPNTTPTFTTEYTVPLDVSIIAVAPHMHLLGTAARAYAVPPVGDTIPLVRIREWDFNWQGSYAFKNPVRVPRNSKLIYEATYDNTVNNPLNPNTPPRTVRWGEATTDEMLLCYFHWLPYQPGDEMISMETQTPSDVSESPMSDSHLSLLLSPNPASENVQVQLALNSAADVTIILTTPIGEPLITYYSDTHFHQGLHTFPIRTDRLASGAYVVVVMCKGAVVSAPLRIVH